MTTELTEDQTNLIKEIAEKEGFKDFEIKASSGSEKGDNYMGIITTVTVQNHEKKLDFILKTSAKSEELRKVVPIGKFFLREIYTYEKIFPEFERFRREQGLLGGSVGHAQFYGSSKKDYNEFLVFQNMKEIGYELWDRKIPMTPDHAELVLKEYAKFHAVSLAMREKRPVHFEELTKDLGNVFQDAPPEKSLKMIMSAVEGGLEAVKGNQVATEALERYALVAEKFWLEDMKNLDEPLVVLHGDCWCNNFLFKNEDQDSNKPTKLCVIDWQLCSKGSPVQDLAYFLFTCCPKEILTDYRKYLKIYHDCVCQNLKNFNCDPEEILPFSSLERLWQKYAKFGIHMALMIIKLMLGETGEVPNFAEIVDSGKDIMTGLNIEIRRSDDYSRRISDILSVSSENDLI